MPSSAPAISVLLIGDHVGSSPGPWAGAPLNRRIGVTYTSTDSWDWLFRYISTLSVVLRMVQGTLYLLELGDLRPRRVYQLRIRVGVPSQPPTTFDRLRE